jgi:hypothetical protein
VTDRQTEKRDREICLFAQAPTKLRWTPGVPAWTDRIQKFRFCDRSFFDEPKTTPIELPIHSVHRSDYRGPLCFESFDFRAAVRELHAKDIFFRVLVLVLRGLLQTDTNW